MKLKDINTAEAGVATRELLRCCGSTRWALRMTQSRPFSTREQMAQTADAIWSVLNRTDWLEAFAAHPRIGAGGSDRSDGTGKPGGAGWSEQEQAGTQSATDDERERLMAANREYEARFGYMFIVCASGKSTGEMLAVLERRLRNDAVQELGVAAEEQRKITALRLRKLLDE